MESSQSQTHNTYPEGSQFPGYVGNTVPESSEQYWPVPPTAASGTPSAIQLVLDDVGFGQLGCFGGLGDRISTPNIDALAAGGIRYTNFHATAMCAPTRASMLTGRNHHSVGMGVIVERATGYPGYHARLPKEAACVSRVLQNEGFSTMALGKWHLTPPGESTAIGPYTRWPLGQGFDRFYGFLAADTDQWQPVLYEDNHRVPRPPGEDYHLSEDLIGKAITWVNERSSISPDRPFFLHLGFGAVHAPHHVPEEWISPYRGVFDDGWDVIRQETLDRQKALGIMPAGTVLPERNVGIRAWADLDADHRALFARQMEVFAGFLTHTDHQIGRLMDALRSIGALDNTCIMVVSDNGASAEGGSDGLATQTSYLNGMADSFESMLEKMDVWGSPATFPHYATGWAMAGNTPNRLYKSFVHEGGTHVPLIVHWPVGELTPGAVRSQFHSVADLVPTMLDVLDLPMPDVVDGHEQMPLEGESFRYTFADGDSGTRRTSQYFEMFGHRAIWKQGWKAVTFHWSRAVLSRLGTTDHELHDGDFDADIWELYHLDEDPSESRNLAHEHPEKLQELIDEWWREIAKYNGLPLDDRIVERERFAGPKPLEPRDVYVYRGHFDLDIHATPDLRDRNHSISVVGKAGDDAPNGVLVADGGADGGYTLYAQNERIHFAVNYLGREVQVVSGDWPAGAADFQVRVEARKSGEHLIDVTLLVDGQPVGAAEGIHTNPITYGTRADGLRTAADAPGVSDAYDSPFAFNGAIESVSIAVDGPEYSDPEGELRAALHRQ